MSATQLAAFIVACVVSAALALGAALLVRWGKRHDPPDPDRVVGGIGATAIGMGLLAAVVFGVGADVATPGAAGDDNQSERCGPGLYDNGGNSNNGPVCIPWSDGGQR